MKEEKVIYKESVVPFYAVGIFWFIYGSLFKLYQLIDFIIVIVLSVIIFIILKKIIKPKETKVIVEKTIDKTGNKLVDSLIVELNKQIEYLSNQLIENKVISQAIDEIIKSCYQMISAIEKDFNKTKMLERFMNYFIPSIEKFINQYHYFVKLESDSAMIKSGIKQIEEAFNKIVTVYKKEVDDLNRNHIMDIQVDIKVMETMFQQDELNIEQFIKQSKGE